MDWCKQKWECLSGRDDTDINQRYSKKRTAIYSLSFVFCSKSTSTVQQRVGVTFLDTLSAQMASVVLSHMMQLRIVMQQYIFFNFIIYLPERYTVRNFGNEGAKFNPKRTIAHSFENFSWSRYVICGPLDFHFFFSDSHTTELFLWQSAIHGFFFTSVKRLPLDYFFLFH